MFCVQLSLVASQFPKLSNRVVQSSSSSSRPPPISVDLNDGPSIAGSFQPFVVIPKREPFRQTDVKFGVDTTDDTIDDDDTVMEAESSNAEATDRVTSLDFDEYSLDILKHMMEKEVKLSLYSMSVYLFMEIFKYLDAISYRKYLVQVSPLLSLCLAILPC